MYVEIHMIQNFAPSCLNRDDTNTPKDCEFGGCRRARISSQCLKRAIRFQFSCEGLFGEKELSVRSRLIVEKVARQLAKLGRDEEKGKEVVMNALSSVSIATGADKKTQYMLFLTEGEIAALTELCNKHWDALSLGSPGENNANDAKGKKAKKKAAKDSLPAEVVKEVKKIFENSKAADLALFGRMIADSKGMNVDGAAQVAHAFSTHRISMEMDFYTAVDDLQPQEESGAGMMGNIGFNSACFYRYGLVNVDQLFNNLKKDKALAAKTVEGFIKGSITAIPTGKQNSMAAHNLPSMIMVVFRDEGQPISMANAFVKPVSLSQDSGSDLVSESVARFVSYYQKMTSMYGSQGIKHAGIIADASLEFRGDNITQYESVDKMVKGVRGVVDAYLASKN